MDDLPTLETQQVVLEKLKTEEEATSTMIKLGSYSQIKVQITIDHTVLLEIVNIYSERQIIVSENRSIFISRK